ncbi:TIGR02530 family flagellar biosynthesis protein [Aminipila sp.]|uniref:TIGR02530 family flagellar biosynthesis protein n=1 Tax=Aminipila sp. TaxID=2060095 RepID=UPI0028A176CF|nr:TIGR02530 family flagellar biosynthesis protein [Aminipila sp.]
MADIKVGNNYQNINQLVGNRSINNVNTANRNAGITPIGADFGTLLKEQLDKNSGIDKNRGLQFSKHAQERVVQRGIELTPELMEELNDAVKKADAKGAKDVVIFDSMNAFIVNVPNKTVVTTMSGSEMRDNVFTNIDGAVIL